MPLSRVKQKSNNDSLSNADNLFRYLSEIDSPQEGISHIEVLRVGTIHDRGLKITGEMLDGYVQNFKDNVYGTHVQVNLEHRRGGEAAGWVTDLYRDGEKLMAVVEWTELGEEKILKKLFRFVSAELAGLFPHHETGDKKENVFIGLALTNTPALKGQMPLALSEELQIEFNQSNMDKKDLLNEVEEKEVVEEATTEEPTETTEEVTTEGEEEAGSTTEDTKEEAEEAESEEESIEETEEPEAEPTEALAEEAEVVALSEHMALKEELSELKSKFELKELSDKVDAELMLSDTNGLGFVKGQRQEVIDFMLALTEEQRGQFVKLATNIRSVELGEKGSSKKMEPKTGSFEDQVVARAAEIMKEKGAKNIEEAQKMAAKELKQ